MHYFLFSGYCQDIYRLSTYLSTFIFFFSTFKIRFLSYCNYTLKRIDLLFNNVYGIVKCFICLKIIFDLFYAVAD